MKKLLIVLPLVILFCVGGLNFLSTLHAGAQAKRGQEVKPTRREAESHAREVYQGRGGNHQNLPAAVAKATGDISTGIGVGMPVLTPFAPTFNLQSYLKDQACATDAIVVGEVKSQSSRLTTDETFILTDNELSVREIIKDNPAAPLKLNSSITVARTGGSVKLNGHTVKATDDNVYPLESGKRYLLFLTFLPDTNTYVASNFSLQLQDNRISKLTSAPQPKELDNGSDAATVLAQVRLAASAACSDSAA